MVLGNYPFLSVVIKENLYSTTRWHVFDGTDYPQVGNKYYNSYKKLFINKIKKNNIEVIYTILPVDAHKYTIILMRSCFKKNQIRKFLVSHSKKVQRY